MIYWFTGQPGAGKTTLANALKHYLEENNLKKGDIFMVDGDDLRNLYENKDYTIKGRVDNITAAQRISKYLHDQGNTVIVSVVAPYLDQREEFKHFLGKDIVEIYVHTTEIRGREQYFASGYKDPKDNFIEINTTGVTVEDSLAKLVNTIWPPVKEDYVTDTVEKKKTYFVDIDGTIFKYRKFGTYETEPAQVIESTYKHLKNLEAEGHMIILTTARPESLYDLTLRELNENNIPFNKLIMGIERGNRYVVNDKEKEEGEDRAIAINVERDQGI